MTDPTALRLVELADGALNRTRGTTGDPSAVQVVTCMSESEIEYEAAAACRAAAAFFAVSSLEAMQIRDRLMASGWPNSRAVGQRLPGGDICPTLVASHARGSSRLLGAWAGPRHGGFVHPTFQFCADGTIHPLLTDLLAALAMIPGLSPARDPSGWGRVFWLHQCRGTLSKRSLAIRVMPRDEIHADPEGLLRVSNDARTPAEVFAERPEAVIALANAESSGTDGGEQVSNTR